MNFLRSLRPQKLVPIYRCINVSNVLNISCWSCGKNVSGTTNQLFCDHCKVLQKPDLNKNYFQIININETYDLSQNDLMKKYKELQKYLHPDKFSQRKEDEQKISEEFSSLVNEAYKTLMDPLSRGIYMLKLKGKEIPEQTEVDDEFLMEIMEKNEEVENATTEEDILKLNKEITEVIEQLSSELSAAFKNEKTDLVLKILTKMKYYTSIDTQIKLAIRNKGIIK